MIKRWVCVHRLRGDRDVGSPFGRFDDTVDERRGRLRRGEEWGEEAEYVEMMEMKKVSLICCYRGYFIYS